MPHSDPRQSTDTGLPVVEGPAGLPRPTTLKGRYVCLEPLATRHADELYGPAHGADRETLWRWMGDGPFADAADFRASVERKATSDDALFLAAVDPDTGQAGGYLSLMQIEPAHRVIEIGNILYTPPLQRTRAGTEAIWLLARHVFETLGYRRLEWKCNALNLPSRRAALRLGFSFEGLFRQHMIVKGRNRDTTWYAMLDADWPDRRRAFERWLEPGNFDAAGRQRLSLAALNGVDTTGADPHDPAFPG